MSGVGKSTNQDNEDNERSLGKEKARDAVRDAAVLDVGGRKIDGIS